ncbi:hypothetical protein MELA_01840 [Candidatus Methylomirabilis lanthanidiphila]|uniref:Uncharacterized protein n=1 Tax=Candidatus Methylomirabilis lanthanidiphila TaxID=2211376 RepID=A0A564ZJF8_9BACT|nr:hypothetical protein [Candidatus Methylomirabilis lanthanidiphila]VUZ85455.1 hypothetical protein MELA_01840 [Candidatus Methylomirabilis lanthanidiphila]
MGRGSGSTAPTVALITAICLLWIYPYCFFHQASTGTSHYVALPDFEHGSSSPSPALCDAHLLHAAVTGQETGAGTKAGLSLQSVPPPATLCEQFWGSRHHELSGTLLPGSRSASLASSNKLHSLYAVYQI